MSINVLVIDDDLRMVTRMMNALKKSDQSNILGEIKVDDSVTRLESIEKYDASQFDMSFDVALIDYQLGCASTGILVSAWIALHLRIPRLSLTSATYPGDPDYFNGSILKNEISDSPELVIDRIAKCVSEYNSEIWLEKQHRSLVEQYQTLVQNKVPPSSPDFTAIQNLLDQFERILDDRQESELEKLVFFERSTNEFLAQKDAAEKKYADLYNKLNYFIKGLKENE